LSIGSDISHDSCHSDHVTAEILFQKFAAAAATANEEIKQFKRLIEDDESKKIFERAKDSRAENPRGITQWRIVEHPDWLARRT
jgi:Ser-tRNA(Ala) deacylase AlaX